MPGPLKNTRHERFAQELAKGSTIIGAYEAAGYKPDPGAASRLSRNANVQARCEELKARIAEKVADGSLKPVHEWPMIWRKGLVAGVDVEQMKADGAVIGEIKKVKVSDRVKRLELIGKHVDVQAWRERLEHSGPNGAPIQTQEVNPLFDVDDFDEEELELYTELVQRRAAKVRGE